MTQTRPLLVLVVTLLLAACAGRPEGMLVVNDVVAPGATEHEIFVATTRGRSEVANAMFSGERRSLDEDVPDLDFAHVAVSVPPTHEPGNVEWPKRPPGDPATDFVTRSRGYVDSEADFAARMRKAVMAKPRGQRNVLLFVHGFNTTFDEGVYRLTQMVHDTGFDGVPVLFTWASRGRVIEYVYDRDSATVARDALEETMDIAARSGAEKITLFAHSMGNWVAVEALRQAKIGGDPDLGGRLDQVVLASPDIDVDVFKSQMRRYGQPKKPFLMLISRDDRALRVSALLAGDRPRVGGYDNDSEIAELGVVVIDLTNVQGVDDLNHSKFALVGSGFVQALQQRLAAGDDLDYERDSTLSDRFGQFGRGLGNTVGGAAGIIITTPLTILTAPVELLRE
ncbi:alpha/beta hydrolase [Methylobrevis pamukkalensis]|uniref:Alpha/beta hydrolase family protein n=1 Tax=Methylobrevis pamukkalensis TaxID=1439726 RepID=A0A1E3GXM2_9HYPH|nr:alpha/beta hydrolase [Methylobrevis pamukkalensis]ODN68802.1 Alpha/beta hydrolase family protein [Methylobrevis pamukkalensis]